MKKILISLLVATSTLAMCPIESALADSMTSTNVAGYRKYTNSRYGFSINVPANFKTNPPPTNGDGRSFYDDYGATFVVWGAHNVLDETVSHALNEALSNHLNVAYSASGKDWYVISYREAGYIVYEKYFISAGFINGWSFKYPVSQASVMNPVCSAVARTFKPGWKNPYWNPDYS